MIQFPNIYLRRVVFAAAVLGVAQGAAPELALGEVRYQLGSSSDGTFVVDSATGRVWRYDRTDDAWYLYDLEALVKQPGARPSRGAVGGDSQGPQGSDVPPAAPPRDLEPEERLAPNGAAGH